MANLLDRIAMVESGGNINARSPTPLSSAQGLFGFTDAAFQQVKQDNPDLAHVTKEQWSVNPELQRTFADRLKKFHEGVLTKQGFEPNPVNIYANWHFGSGGGPKFLKSAPDTRMEDILDPVAIAANPHLQGKTQGQIYEWITKKMNGSALPNATAQTRGNTAMNPNQPQGTALPNATAAYNQRDPMEVYAQLLARQTNAAPQQLTPEQQQALMGDRQRRASVLPLAIGASLAGDKRVSALGGQLYQDATDAMSPMKMGNEGWMTADGQLISNPFNEATREENRKDRLLQLALSAANRSKSPDPYYTSLQTSQGIFNQNARTGEITPAIGPDGKQLIGAQFDPRLQGSIANEKAVGTKQGEATVKSQVEIANARSGLKSLDAIDVLLNLNPTASTGGALIDQALGFFGQSTQGGDVAAALKTEANKILMSVPRFEGPQSDKDTASYREAAGDLGNEKLPISKRRAAVNQIREIMNRNIQNGTIKFNDQTPNAPATEQPTQNAPAKPRSVDDILNLYK